jgi:Transposase
VFVGIDCHKHRHAAALLDARGGLIDTLLFSNRPDGYRELIAWLVERDAATAIVGVEKPAGFGRPLRRRSPARGLRSSTFRRGARIATGDGSGRARPTGVTRTPSRRSSCAAATSSARRSSPSPSAPWGYSSCSAIAWFATAR